MNRAWGSSVPVAAAVAAAIERSGGAKVSVPSHGPEEEEGGRCRTGAGRNQKKTTGEQQTHARRDQGRGFDLDSHPTQTPTPERREEEEKNPAPFHLPSLPPSFPPPPAVREVEEGEEIRCFQWLPPVPCFPRHPPESNARSDSQPPAKRFEDKLIS